MSTTKNSEYDPKIEERRADYDKLADCLAVIWDLELTHSPSRMDLGELEYHLDGDDPHPVMSAIRQHLEDLYRRIDFTEATALKKFYAELRLFGDQQDLDRNRNRKAKETK